MRQVKAENEKAFLILPYYYRRHYQYFSLLYTKERHDILGIECWHTADFFILHDLHFVSHK